MGNSQLAKKVYLLILLSFGITLAFGLTASASSLEIIVNIPGLRLYLYENGVRIREYPISIGNVLKPSLLGTTNIVNRVVDPTYFPPQWWERGLEPMPPGPDNPVGTRWLGLGFPSYGIHGTNDPDSIGKAVTSGCVRLHNEDVEELFELVDQGTSVSFLYKTVLVHHDPIISTPTITVYPDVYNMGSTEDEVLQILNGLTGLEVFLPALEGIVGEATGKQRPIPLQIPMEISPHVSNMRAVRIGKQVFVPLPSSFNGDFPVGKFDSVVFGDKPYVRVGEFSAKLGFTYALGDQLELYPPQAFLNGHHLGPAVVYNDEETFVPIDLLKTEFGLPLEWVRDEGIVSISGRYGVEAFEFMERVFIPVWTVEWLLPEEEIEIVLPKRGTLG